MLPQACDLWPPPVTTAFAEMDNPEKARDRDWMARRCEQVIAILQEMEAVALDLPTRRKVARSFLNLAGYFKQLGRTEDAKRVLEQARDQWNAILAADPADF